MNSEPDPLYFAKPHEWRQWLAEHHADRRELWVGLHKKGSGRPSITWPEAVDQALCFGWIDGVRKTVDEDSYRIRFTPRKPGSTWSKINIQRVGELAAQGLMHAAGLKAFEARTPERSGVYSFEQRDRARLEPAHEKLLSANAAAWDFFQAQPPWYRKTAIWWIVSAKRDATRLRRLMTLIESSAQGRTIPPLSRSGT
jgi:uncharacterized protein YdeI (YjbR/CyaY-like superfamily)